MRILAIETSCAETASFWPLRLALVAVRGPPRRRASSRATGWLESRMPILPVPAVSSEGMLGAARKTSVSGPGQKSRMRGTAASGTSASSGATTSSVYADGTTADKYIDRSFFAFDLSSIPVGADIISATLSLYVSAKGSDAGGAVGIVEGTQASASTLATSDYSLFGTTEFASRINFASATAGAYSAFALNASGW